MKTGWIVTCPKCGAKIDEFSLCDEWECECGESGILDDDEGEEE